MAWHSPVPRALRLLPRGLRDRLVRARTRVRERELADVTVTLAESAADLRAAGRLLHDACVARGFMTQEPGGVLLTPHYLLPATLTFVAWSRGQVLGTVSLFTDGPLGLPSESLLPDDLARLRSRRRRVAEAGALALAPGHRGHGVTYLLAKALYRCAVELLGVDDLVIAVHPDAEDYCRAVLCFRRLLPPQQCPGLSPKARAVVMRLDLRSARWTWFQSFGHLPARANNPYHMFIERRDPQIVMPESVDAAACARRAGLADLLQSYPTALAAVPPRLAALLTEMVGPPARVPNARIWDAVAFWDRPLSATRSPRNSPRRA